MPSPSKIEGRNPRRPSTHQQVARSMRAMASLGLLAVGKPSRSLSLCLSLCLSVDMAMMSAPNLSGASKGRRALVNARSAWHRHRYNNFPSLFYSLFSLFHFLLLGFPSFEILKNIRLILHLSRVFNCTRDEST